MNVYDFARHYLTPYKTKGDEILPTYCPFCKGGSNHDKDSFALNTKNKTYNCKRGSCNKQGHFTQLCKEFGEVADMENMELYKPVRSFKKPKTELKPTTTQAESYLALRKISKATMDKFNISCDNKGNIVFPFYENEEVTFVKFRPACKVEKGSRKSWREEGTKPILFGMQHCTPDKPLVITEGEIDALSVYEAGVENVVSVPSGSEDFTWVEYCWDWINQFNQIIIFGDSDNAGKEMTKKLIQKLGSFRCSVVEIEYKDANELLYRNGKEAIVNAVKNAKEIPVYGLVDLADISPLDIKNMQTISTGIRALDQSIGGFRLGELSVWTGKRGEGKSTLMSQLMIEVIENDNKVCCYSGELKAQDFQYWTHLQMAGKGNVETYFDSMSEKNRYYVKPEIKKTIMDWHRGKFFLYDNTVTASKAKETTILKIFEYAVKKYDCKVFLVDNLMTAKYDHDSEKDFYLKQINFVRDLIDFASSYNVHVHLVAHPKKTKGDLDNDDISGRAEITNLAHNVFSVQRVEKNDKEAPNCDVVVNILKNRWEGARKKVGMLYCPVSRRLYMESVGAYRKYGWDKNTPYKQLSIPIETDSDCPF